MVKPTTDHARMQRRVNEVVHPKNLGPALNRHPDQVRKWARDPEDASADDTGCRGPLSMVRTMFRELALHGPEGRACAVELREWLCGQADEALGVTPSEPTTADLRFRAVADAMREAGEAFAKCNPASPDFAVVVKEFSEAIEAMQQVIRTCAPSTRGPLSAA